MSVLLCVTLLRLRFLSTPFRRTLATTASTASRGPQLSSYTVDFLTTSCALTHAQALCAARTLRFDEKTRQQPESVIALLRSRGFSDAQIAGLVARFPRVLLCRAQVNLGPKLQFLTQEGLSTALIAECPRVLVRSLDRHIRPCFDFLRSFVGSADDLHAMLRHRRQCFAFNLKTSMIPNVGLLLELGVAVPAISRLMVSHPRALMNSPERFMEVVQIVQDWGVKPNKKMFPHAIRAVCAQRKSTLAAKLELFKRLGWSEEEVKSAFRSCPLCIAVSEKKIMRMNSFAGKLGLGPSNLSRLPALLMYSFDKRILPRYAVWLVLTSEGLTKQRIGYPLSVFNISEKLFLDRYVKRYMDKVPELMDVYLGKTKFEGFDLADEQNRRQKLRPKCVRQSA